MTDRQKDKLKVKRILRSNVDGDTIAKVLNDYFKKHCVTDAKAVKKEAAVNVMEVFDGSLF